MFAYINGLIRTCALAHTYSPIRTCTDTQMQTDIDIHSCGILYAAQRQPRSIHTIIHYAFIWTTCLTVVDNDLCLSVHIIPVLHNTSEGAFKHGFFPTPSATHLAIWTRFPHPFPLLRPHSHSSSHSQCPPHSPPNHTLFPIPREAFASGENNS